MKIISFETIDSTNEYAKKISSESEDFTVIWAKRQTEGKGRLNRRWESPEGGLWISVILKPEFFSSLLSFIPALAVVKTLKEFGIVSKLKWPNDILVSEKKISGILLEKNSDAAIIGIGLNVNIEKINTNNWTSMSMETGKKFNLRKVLDILIENIEHYYMLYEKKEFLKIRLEWKENSSTLGKFVIVETVSGTFYGKAVDIDENGFLVMDNGKKINSGDIVHLR